MASKFRKHPLTCLLISIFLLLVGRLRLKKQFLHKTIKMDNNSTFQIFRDISIKRIDLNPNQTIFIVRFKFLHLSFKANKMTSLMPMLLITGFPGFQRKIYWVNHLNGYWQGMYQWASEESIEEHKKSLVFRMMNKRAISESLSSEHFVNNDLESFINDRII